MKKYVSCSILLLLMISCQNNNGIDKNFISNFAKMECRAMQLKQQRFALANQIRFTQDTLLQKIPATDTATLKERLARFETEKQTLLQKSLVLADSIKIGLDSLMQQVFVTAADRKAFDKDLKNELRQLGCTDANNGHDTKK